MWEKYCTISAEVSVPPAAGKIWAGDAKTFAFFVVATDAFDMWGHSLNLDTSSLNHEVSDKNAYKKVALGCPRAAFLLS